MVDRIISAEVRIDGKDNTGAAFAAIGKKIDNIGKAGKGSAGLDGMVKSLERAQAQLKAIDTLQARRDSFGSARTKFRETQVAVDQAARAMRSAGGATKALQADYDRARMAVTKASTAFERQKSALLDSKRALEGFGAPINKLAGEQVRLRSVIDQTTRSIENQVAAERRAATAHSAAERAAERRAEGMAHHGLVRTTLGAAAGYASVHGVMTGIERTVEAGSAYQHEIIGFQNAGRTPEEIAAIRRRSAEVSGRLPTAGLTDNMKVIAETTPAFGSVEHAMDHLEFMQKAMSVLKASGGEHIKGGVGDVGRALAKTFEERFTKSENFESEAGAMIPAMVASGGVFNPEQLYAFAQQAKSALPNYNMRFLSRIAPSLIGAQGGDRAGTAANAFNSIIMGKVNDKKQAEAWEHFGLLDDSKVIKKAGNVVSWQAGAVKGTDLALRDPLEWAEKVALPAMIAKGVSVEERLELAKVLGTMFRNQNGNMFANEIMQADSRARLHKDEALTNRVGGLNDIYQRDLGDARIGLEAFKTSLENLMAATASPLMGRAATGLSGLASNINSFANMMQAHPEFAASAGIVVGGGALMGAGVASYQLMNGFGLGTSAVALDSSAAALHGAAIALDGAALKGGVGGVFGGLGKGAVIEAETIAATIAGEGTLALAGAVSIGTLMIAGVAATAIIAALSQDKRKLAADQPGFGDVFGQPFQMPAGAGLLPSSLGGGRGQEPGSINKANLPGHWITARGGIKQWVVDGTVAPYKGTAPFFARGGMSEVNVPFGTISDTPMGAGHTLIGASAPTVQGGMMMGPLTAKIEGQAMVAVTVKVDGPGTVTGQYAWSTGNIQATTGSSMAQTKATASGRAVGPV